METDPNGRLAQAMDRAFALLEATSSRPLGFAALQEHLAMGPAATSRLLKALVTHGLVEHSGEVYGPGPRARALAARLGGTPDLASLAGPAMRSLAEACGDSAACFVPVDDGIRLVAKYEPSERFHYLAEGGINRGIDRHAGCRLRAAWWSESAARQRFAELGRSPDVEAWLADGRLLREAGFLLTPSDDQPGIARAAAAIINRHGDLAGIIVVTGIAAGWNGAHAANVLDTTRRCAADLSRALGASLP